MTVVISNFDVEVVGGKTVVGAKVVEDVVKGKALDVVSKVVVATCT